MASWRGAAAQTTENGPRAKCDQVVFEAIAKAAEIVVGSRCYIGGAPGGSDNPFLSVGNHPNAMNGGLSNSGNTGSRFNLMVPEVQGVRSILQRWKRALHVPLRLDVYYQHPDQRRELLERWCLEYAPSHFQQQQHLDLYSSDPIVQLRYVCKKIVIWLRTLYCWSRMLPSQALRRGTGNGGAGNMNNTIGFSIYVVSEGNDDVTQLVSNQQFLAQGQPSSVLTPYGELGWKVFYASRSVVDRLVPRPLPYRRTRSDARPIPNSTDTNNGNNYYPQQPQSQAQFEQQVQRHNSSPLMQPTVQSAPQHNRHMMYHRSNSAVESPPATTRLTPELHRTGRLRSNSSNSRGIIMSAAAAAIAVADQISPQPLKKPLFGGTSAAGTTSTTTTPQVKGTTQNNIDNNATGEQTADGQPPRAMSGLSLAMMLSDDTIDDNNSNPDADTTTTTTNDQAEKRRAALHHAPPPQYSGNADALASSPVLRKSNLTSAGDYGYAYNSHIPLLRHNGNNRVSPIDSGTPGTGGVDRTASPSPSFQAGTPPTGAGFLMGATPPKGGGFLSGGTVTNPSSLVPPRSAVTPPFVRPLGFVTPPNDPLPTQQLPPSATDEPASATPSGTAASVAGMTATPGASHHTSIEPLQTTHGGGGGGAVAAAGSAASGAGVQGRPYPVTSLDLLHSSPFQQSHNGSLLSSHSIPQDPNSYMNSVLSGDFRLQAAAEFAYGGTTTAADNPFNHSTSAHQYYYHGGLGPSSLDFQDDMPFAVDASSAAPLNSSGAGLPFGSASTTASTNSNLASSQAVASFAQRCATASRLALFDSIAQQQQQQQSVAPGKMGVTGGTKSIEVGSAGDMVSSLADQLAEFKTFGASLQIDNRTTTATGPHGIPPMDGSPMDSAAASTSTPISLRT